MPAIQAATKPNPLAEAEAEVEAARADVERLTAKIKELKQGATADPILVNRLESEREAAFKTLRGADLETSEQAAADEAPISAKTIDKIRRMRRKVEGLHASTLARTGEHRRLREHRQGLQNEIAALTDSWEFKRSHQEFLSPFVRSPRDPQLAEDHSGPPRGSEKTPEAVRKLARLERELETTAAELQIAVTAQVKAQARWEAEKHTLNGWERAARSLGPAARAMLDALPLVGAQSSGEITRQVDFREVNPGYATPMIRGG